MLHMGMLFESSCDGYICETYRNRREYVAKPSDNAFILTVTLGLQAEIPAFWDATNNKLSLKMLVTTIDALGHL